MCKSQASEYYWIPLVLIMMEGVSGWIFKNESDCFNFFKEGGSIANYRTCPTKDLNSTSTSSLMMKKEECGMMGGSSWSSCCPCCPPVWDGFLCWPPTSINTVVEQPCPANIHQINSNSKERRGGNIFVNISNSLWDSEILTKMWNFPNKRFSAKCTIFG